MKYKLLFGSLLALASLNVQAAGCEQVVAQAYFQGSLHGCFFGACGLGIGYVFGKSYYSRGEENPGGIAQAPQPVTMHRGNRRGGTRQRPRRRAAEDEDTADSDSSTGSNRLYCREAENNGGQEV